MCVREDCQENPRDQDSFQQMGNIKDLPDDVLGLILSRLFVPDLLTALRVNRWFHEVMETTWFWKSTYLQRFGANPSPTIALGGEGGEGFKKACLDKTVAKKSAALECHIIWADVGYYWKMVKDVASEYGRVAELGNVCWFEVNANFERIPRGVYRITWRVRFKDALLHLFSDLKMVARAVPQEAEEAESGEGWTIQDAFDYHKYRKKNRREKVWTELSHPSLLVVKFPLARVQVRLFDHSNSWKSGIKLDWCKLSYE